MSQNADTTHALYQAFARGDIPFVLGVFHPQIEWNEAENFIYADGNPYVGPQAILAGVFARLGSEWNGFSATPEQILDAGDTIVALGRYRGRQDRARQPAPARSVEFSADGSCDFPLANAIGCRSAPVHGVRLSLTPKQRIPA